MLVVPNHWGDAPIIAGSPFGTRLRNWADAGIEMFLHGYFHRDDSLPQSSFDRFKAHFMTAGEGEFLSLPREAAANRINEGQELIEDVIGRPIAGFVAPAWLYGRGALDALRDNAVSLAEDHMRIWSPKTGKQLAQGPVITWASRTRMRLASSLAAAALLRHAPFPSCVWASTRRTSIIRPLSAVSRERSKWLALHGAAPVTETCSWPDSELDHECNGGFLRTGWSVADPEALAFFAPVHVRESHPDHRIWSEIPMGKHALN